MFQRLFCLFHGHLWTFHSRGFRCTVIECERCGRKDFVL